MPILYDIEKEHNFNIRKTLVKHKKIIIVSLLTVLTLVVTVGALQIITSPDSDPVNVSVLPTLSKPTLNATSLNVGDTLQISCSISPVEYEGENIFLYENDVQVASGIADSSGIVTFNRLMSSPGTFIYHCTAEV